MGQAATKVAPATTGQLNAIARKYIEGLHADIYLTVVYEAKQEYSTMEQKIRILDSEKMVAFNKWPQSLRESLATKKCGGRRCPVQK